MAFITELLGYIGLDVDSASFDDAEDSVRDVTKVMAGLITVATTMASAVTGAAWSLVNDFAESATEIDRLTKRLNVNAEAFQATAYAARAFGIEQDQLADGMKELSMRSAEFAQDGKANADAFGAIGISQAQVKQYGNNIEGLFELVRQKLSEVKEQGQRQFLADALFGGGLADVGGEFFSQTSERIEALQKQARESGVVISQESLDMAREYTREMGALQTRIKGLWNIVASNLLPVFTGLTRQAKEFFDLHGDEIVKALTAAIKGLIESIKYLGVAAAVALPYLVGTAAMASWAKLIALTNSLTAAFMAMRTGALLAWAAAAIGPALVGAAVLSLILVIQDLYTYFTGGDSITGRIIDGLGKPVVDKIKKAWDDLKLWFKSWFAEMKANIRGWFDDLLPDWVAKPSAGDAEFRYSSPGNITSPLLAPPQTSVTAPPTMAQGMAAANSGRGNVVTTNSGNTTFGDININTNQDGATFAEQFRREYMRNNASTVKGLDTGVKY